MGDAPVVLGGVIDGVADLDVVGVKFDIRIGIPAGEIVFGFSKILGLSFAVDLADVIWSGLVVNKANRSFLDRAR